jgi:hypothetical protein
MTKFITKYWQPLLILTLTFHLVLLVKLKFTAWPEMVLWPYLLLQGLLPYKDIAMAHSPLLVLKLAVVYKIFGVGILQLKVFTWLVIILTDVLVFAISNKLWKKKVALFSVITYVVLQLFYDGNGLWFDLLLAPLAIATFYVTITKKYFFTGILFALMFLTKQTAIWFLFPIAISVSKGKLPVIKEAVTKFVLGNAVVFTIFLLLLITFGLLPDFYNWAVSFGLFILPRSVGQIQLPDIKNLIVSLFPFSLFIPLLLVKRMKIKNLAMWTMAGILGAYPRFEYFHFQPGIAFLAFGTSIFFVTFNKKDILSKILIPVYVVCCFYLSFSFVVRNYNEGVRFYEANVQEVAQYVREHTVPGDKIFVLNWWDNIYALTNTLPATDPWVPQLFWYQELPGIQDAEVENMAKSKPKLIVFQDYSDTGLASYKPKILYNFITANYKFVQKIDGVNILIPN